MFRPLIAGAAAMFILAWSINSFAGTCAFNSKKGKYIKCTSFSKGVCKAGTSACDPKR